MAEIRCPICDTMNPADAETCRFCGARLHPEAGEINSSPQSDQTEDLFGDLRELGGLTGQEDEIGSDQLDKDHTEPADGEEPEWLQRIRELSQQEEVSPAGEPADIEEDAPEWIQALTEIESSEPEVEDEAARQGEPDAAGEDFELPVQEPWKREDAFSQEAQQDSAPDETEAVPDWLQELSLSDRGSEIEPVEGSEPPDEAEREQALGQPPQQDENLPDWLRSFDTGSSPAEDAEDVKPSPEDEPESVSDFSRVLTEAGSEEEQEPEIPDEDDLSDWLSAFEKEMLEPEQEILPQPEQTPEPAAPVDAGLEENPEASAEMEPTAEKEEEETPPEVMELPSASEILAMDEGASEGLPEEAADADDRSEFPDWMWSEEIEASGADEREEEILDGMPIPQEETPEGLPGETESAEEDEIHEVDSLPDWLMDAELDGAVDEAVDEVADEVELDEIELDDIESIEGSPEDLEELDQKREEKEASGEPAEEFIEGDDLSVWLGDLSLDETPPVFETGEQASVKAQDTSETIPPFFREDLDTWIDKGEEPQAGEPEDLQEGAETVEEAAQEGLHEDLPDWLTGEPSKEVSSREPSETEPEEISEGALPGWLNAMRPIESVLPEQIELSDEKKVEQSGPLAGLAGVLPAKDVVTGYHKPPVYSLKLQVSEKQRAHAAMFENMLEEEQRAVSVKRMVRRKPQRFLRALIGLILSAVILLPLLGVPTAGLKVGQVADIGAFNDVIEALPAGSSALIAVDYAPGFSGEMRFAATGALMRLMMREVRVAVVSTQPSGPVLAEGLKMRAFERWPDVRERYSQRDWYINLGYLPGETVSLQELARSPRQAVQYGISAGLNNQFVWDSSVLQDIEQLDDFGVIILITDTVEAGRSWIEQVSPTLDEAPFLLITSAQAAPMLQPYLQSGQVQGMLSGMAGGISYEEMVLIPDLDRSASWLAHQFALAAILLILLLGAIIESISSLLGRNRPGQEV